MKIKTFEQSINENSEDFNSHVNDFIKDKHDVQIATSVIVHGTLELMYLTVLYTAE